MIETHAVETVLEREHALDLVRLDHAGEHIAHPQGLALAPQIVSDRENSTEVVGGVAPLGGEPGIVEIKPSNHGPDVECGHYRVELVRGSRNARPAAQGSVE